MHAVIFIICSTAIGLCLTNKTILINSISYISHRKRKKSVHSFVIIYVELSSIFTTEWISILSSHWWISVPSLKILHIWGMGKFSTVQILSSCISNPVSSLLLIHIQIKPWFSSVQFRSVQWLSRVQLFTTPRIAARQASLSITNSQSLLKLTSIESVIPSNRLILCHPLILPALNLSQHQGLFQWVNSSREMAKVLEFQL